STISSNLVNEARVGYSWAPVSFFSELNPGMYTGALANTQGFHLILGTVNSALTDAGAAPQPQSRNATATAIEDTVTWLKGNHSLSMGTSYTQYSIWAKNSNLVPTVRFDLSTSDPQNSLFTTTNFPGASQNDLTAAAHLYAMLIGRVGSLNTNNS